MWARGRRRGYDAKVAQESIFLPSQCRAKHVVALVGIRIV